MMTIDSLLKFNLIIIDNSLNFVVYAIDSLLCFDIKTSDSLYKGENRIICMLSIVYSTSM